ncbi:MAG: FxDxF family PEP-CTERM protein [Pseudomonadota bacterium]
MHSTYPSNSLVLAALLGTSLMFPLADASAQGFLDNNEPPALLDYATGTPLRESRVTAWSTYQGSLRFTPCSDSGAFWACRNVFNSTDASNPANRAEAMATNNNAVSAVRTATAFDYTQSTTQINYSYFADITPATSGAKAQSDFGSNRAEASAWNGRYWTETRVQNAWDPTESSVYGATSSGAAAWSTYTEVFTPSADGQITLEFELRQHPSGGNPGGTTGYPNVKYDGYAVGSLLVQVFDLDSLHEYWRNDSSYPIEGPAFIGSGEIGRDWMDGTGTSFLSVVFDVTGGTRYSLVSQLSVFAEENASADFYGTASLERILVTPGMSLGIGSGSTYNIAAVPEAETYAMMLAGLGLVGFAARRRLR